MRRLSAAAALLALVMASPAAAATIVIDPFSGALPANACLPASGARVVFSGAYCDGPTCPPAFLVDACPGSDFAGQIGPDYGGTGFRVVALTPLVDPPPQASARIDDALHLLRFDCPDGGCESSVDLNYDRYGYPLDLASAGMNSVAFTVGGAVSAQSPLPVYFVLQSSITGLYATVTVQLVSPGPVVIPFSAFEVDPGFDFEQVDWVGISFGPCDRFGCYGSAPIPSFTLENLRIDSEAATPARRSTWGALKSAYR